MGNASARPRTLSLDNDAPGAVPGAPKPVSFAWAVVGSFTRSIFIDTGHGAEGRVDIQS